MHSVSPARRIFGFREVQCFDIKGEYTGLTSRALTSPCGKIRIPINEPKGEKGSTRVDQIQEFIERYRGEDRWDKRPSGRKGSLSDAA